MALDIDDSARPVLEQHAGQSLAILLVNGYGLGVEALSLEWSPTPAAFHDRCLVPLGLYHGVALYAHERVAAYLRWHTLRLRGRRHAWWRGLTLDEEQATMRALKGWERTHPGLRGPAQPALGL